MHRLSRFAPVVVALATVLAVARGLVAEPPAWTGIAELAPRSTFVVVSVEDWSAARAAFDRSSPGRLWAEPEFRTFVHLFAKDTITGMADSQGEDWLAESLKEVGIDPDDLAEPTGPAGFAVFLEPSAAPNDGKKSKLTHEVHFLGVAEFGDKAESMERVVDQLIKESVKNGAKETEEFYEGKVIRVITRTTVDSDAAAPDGMNDDEGFDADGGSGPWSMDSLRSVRFCRVGGTLCLGTSKAAMESTIGRLAGEATREGRSLASSPLYTAAIDQHPAGSHAIAALLVTDEVRTSFTSLATSGLPLLGDENQIRAVLDSLGLGALDSVSLGLRFDADQAAVEQTVGVAIKEKSGLFSLLDAVGTFTAPPFIGREVASLRSVGVRFDRVIPLARSVFQSLPKSIQQDGAGYLAAFEASAAPFLGALSNEVCVVTHVKRPYGPDSDRTLLAIKTKDVLALANQLNALSAGFGMEPRDFQGGQIFESGDGDGPSIGLGLGYAFVGRSEDIENAMRLASDAALPRLADSDRFKAGASLLPDGAVVYSYENFAEAIGFAYWSIENAETIYKAQLAEWGMDAASIDEEVADFREHMPEWHKHLPPVRLILEHLGDNVSSLSPTPDGFRGRSLMLKPQK
ncbi:MAG: hypothetical protein KF745_03715 [Phycisphaeraceae bacterium]|nr:hypothetical protein [Phycisphaeraceae bacterium]